MLFYFKHFFTMLALNLATHFIKLGDFTSAGGQYWVAVQPDFSNGQGSSHFLTLGIA